MSNRERFLAGEIFGYEEIPEAKLDQLAVSIGPDFTSALPTYLRYPVHHLLASTEYVEIFNYVFGEYVEVKLFFSKMRFADQEAAAV